MVEQRDYLRTFVARNIRGYNVDALFIDWIFIVSVFVHWKWTEKVITTRNESRAASYYVVASTCAYLQFRTIAGSLNTANCDLRSRM